MNYSVIPYVVGRFRVADWNEGGRRRYEEVQLLQTDPLNFQVSQAEIDADIPVKEVIAAQLRELIAEQLEIAVSYGIEELLDDRVSPPVKILREEVEDADDILRRSYFQIVGVEQKISTASWETTYSTIMRVNQAAKIAKAKKPQYLRVAGAIESIHSYSLIHDDLPSMDNDDFRRGKLK